MTAFAGDSIALTFTADLSQARAAYDQFLADVSRRPVPVQFQGGGAAAAVGASISNAPGVGGVTSTLGAGIGASALGGISRGLPAAVVAAQPLQQAASPGQPISAGNVTINAGSVTLNGGAAEAGPAAGDAPGIAPGAARGGGGRGRIFGLRAGRLGYIASAGFVLNEAFRTAEAYAHYRESAYEAGNDPLAQLHAEGQLQHSVTSVPLVGPLLGFLTAGYQNTTDRIVNSAARQAQASEGRQADVDALRASRERIDELGAPSYLRPELRIRTDYEANRREIEKRRGERLSAASSDAAREAKDDFQAAQVNFQTRSAAINRDVGGQLNVAAQVRDAELAERNRLIGLDIQTINRRYPELHAAVEGQTGLARQRAFERGLQDEEAAAFQRGPQYLREVRRANVYRRAIDVEQSDFRISQNRGVSAGLEFLLERDPLNAQLTESAERRREALREAYPREHRSINDRFDKADQLIRQNDADNRIIARGRLNVENAGLAILANGPGTYAERQTAAAASDIYGQTLLASLAAIQGSRPELLGGLKRRGQLQLQSLQQQLLAGFRSEEVDLNRVAVSNPQDDLKKISDIAKDVAKIPGTLDEISGKLDGFDKVK